MAEYWIILPNHKIIGIIEVSHCQRTASVVSCSSFRSSRHPFRSICKKMFLDSEISYTCEYFYILDKKYI